MVFEALAERILDWANWGITIVVIMIIYEFIRLFMTPKKANENLIDQAKSGLGQHFKRWWHKDKVAGINEALEEEKEVQLVSDVKNKVTEATAEVVGVRNKKQLTNVDLTVKMGGTVKDIGTGLDDAIKEFRRLNRKTFRQEKKMKELLESLDKKEKDELKDVQVYENQILGWHKEAKEALEKARSHFQSKIDYALEGLKNCKQVKGAAFPISFAVNTSEVDKRLKSLQDALEDKSFLAEIEVAEKAQHEAQRDLQGIIGKSRVLWAE